MNVLIFVLIVRHVNNLHEGANYKGHKSQDDDDDDGDHDDVDDH